MAFDPNTWIGSISEQVVAGILTAALLFVFGYCCLAIEMVA